MSAAQAELAALRERVKGLEAFHQAVLAEIADDKPEREKWLAVVRAARALSLSDRVTDSMEPDNKGG